MKLTEKQLANIFRQSKNSDIESEIGDLYESAEASDKRLNEVEKIANNSSLSASYQLANHLNSWTDSLSKDIKSQSQSKGFFNLNNWLRPTLATATLAFAVYFLAPAITPEIEQHPIQENSMMFTGSFEKSTQKKTLPKKKPPVNSDTIYKSTFS